MRMLGTTVAIALLAAPAQGAEPIPPEFLSGPAAAWNDLETPERESYVAAIAEAAGMNDYQAGVFAVCMVGAAGSPKLSRQPVVTVAKVCAVLAAEDDEPPPRVEVQMGAVMDMTVRDWGDLGWLVRAGHVEEMSAILRLSRDQSIYFQSCLEVAGGEPRTWSMTMREAYPECVEIARAK